MRGSLVLQSIFITNRASRIRTTWSRLDHGVRQDAFPNCRQRRRVRFRIHNNDFTELDDRNHVFQDLLRGKPEDYGLDHEDVRASADSRRSRADDLMVVGSKWMIGQTIWVVTERSDFAWDNTPGSPSVITTLECTATLGLARIGIAGRRVVTEPLGGYEGLGLKHLVVLSRKTLQMRDLTAASTAALPSGTSVVMKMHQCE